uniref:Uncharacterized protein n=1 Tax=Anopheles funestus TaxID=62324 RepID=A0A4Y0BEJ3_ANOFN
MQNSPIVNTSSVYRQLNPNESNQNVSVEILPSNPEIERLKSENKLLKNVNSNLRNKLNELNQENALYKAENVALKREQENRIESNINFNDLVTKIKTVPKGSLSDNQIELILQQKQRVKWTNNEISSA